ncbi:MAG: primosomal protein N' [Oliverpabstia sp.]|nr:primosomal protein N' [Lachnospiraceae bacterium]MDY5027016.1 primosomal protein N' [Oliverpabstia sp.]
MSEQKWFADIIVDITSEKLDRTFQYKIPSEMVGILKPGMQVSVPFGNGGRTIRGYVIQITDHPSYEMEKMKEILSVEDNTNSIESRLIALAAWMRKQYGSTMIQALKTVLPVKQKIRQREERWISLKITREEAERQLELYKKKHHVARQRILEAVLEEGELAYTLAANKLHVAAGVLKTMEEQGIFRIQSRTVYRNPVQETEIESEVFTLTVEQQRITDAILEGWKQNDNRPCLIRGVTGSGKTQVYMELMDKVLKEGRQVILLIPEIALTYQTVLRFYHRFGDRVSVLHSRLSQGERSDQFERAKKGEIQIMIGPRSALFTPFPDLGLILIDEEHETSYQSETTPCYHARETAIARAELESSRVVMGSATPSVDAYYRAKQGRYRLFEMEHRYENRSLPIVYTVDLREELKEGNRSILSRKLQAGIEERLRKKEQVMLFLNRRGYAGFMSCRACGSVMKCPHCDVSLSLHRHGRMVCHYCGYETGQPEQCPRCGSPYIGGFRAGTQQIEDIVKKMYPQARVLRMDLDTTKKKEGHAQILSAFANQEADILIGTQMIVKGHDFPKVTLVGVLAADLSLNISDYRASERTFQLLTQAVGRAGRGETPGEAVIQTYQPEHYSIQAAIRQDYPGFYQEEIEYRQLMSYPPVSNLFAVRGSSMDEELLTAGMGYIRRFLRKVDVGGHLQMIGPADEPVAKVADMYRQVLYVKHENMEQLLRAKDKLEQYIEINSGFKNIRIQFQFNN